VLAKEAEGVQAGKEAPVVSMRESDTILLGYRRQERLELVLNLG
jgi:hypothetical protein